MTDRLIHEDWRNLNATQRDILLVLAQTPENPPTGMETHRLIRGQGREKAKRTTYRNLNTLEELGYIEDVDGGKRLTESGGALVEHGVLEPAREIGGVVEA